MPHNATIRTSGVTIPTTVATGFSTPAHRARRPSKEEAVREFQAALQFDPQLKEARREIAKLASAGH